MCNENRKKSSEAVAQNSTNNSKKNFSSSILYVKFLKFLIKNIAFFNDINSQ